MKVLITGASGFVGTKLLDYFQKRGDEVLGTYFNTPFPDLVKLDVTDPNAVKELTESFRPELVIHAAGMGRPDDCEKNPELASKVNFEGTRNVAEASSNINAALVFFSSIYVFDGKKELAYTESDTPSPLSVYGKTKTQAEELVRALPHHIILRTDMIYGYNGEGKKNGLVGVIKDANNPLYLDSKTLRQPAFLDDIPNTLSTLLDQDKFGIFNIAGEDRITQLEISRKIRAIVGGDSDLSERSDVQTVGAAPRPENIEIDIRKARNLGIQFTGVEGSIQTLKETFSMAHGPEGTSRPLSIES